MHVTNLTGQQRRRAGSAGSSRKSGNVRYREGRRTVSEEDQPLVAEAEATQLSEIERREPLQTVTQFGIKAFAAIAAGLAIVDPLVLVVIKLMRP